MFKKKYLYITIASFLLIINSCKTSEETPLSNTYKSYETKPGQNAMNARSPIIIYKTYKDYYNNIPVSLSADKTKIVSYPGINDIYYNGEIAYPTKLARGYLLDNRGIGINSAFLKMTYDEYIKFSATPSSEEIYEMIIDSDPFSEMYRIACNRDTIEINKIITQGFKENCIKIK